MAPPKAAQGSNLGIASPGGLLRTVPVTRPTSRMPKDITAEKKMPSLVSIPAVVRG